MKLIVRTIAVALLLTGLVVSTHSQSTVASHPLTVSHQVSPSMMPAPACPPDDPDGCGIGPNPK